MDLDSAAFIVLDVETTGLDPAGGHRVCEVGAIRLVGGKEKARFHSLVNPERGVDPAAFRQHRITDGELSAAPKFSAISADLRRFLAGGVLVAQNAAFDLSFLNAEFARCGMAKLAVAALDTIPLARRVRPGLPSYGLDSLVPAFGLTARSRHRSIGDCELAAQVFLACMAELRRRKEVRTLPDLIRLGAFR